MKVALVSTEMQGYAHIGGLGSYTAGLAKYLRKAGVDVTVIMPNYRDPRQDNYPLGYLEGGFYDKHVTYPKEFGDSGPWRGLGILKTEVNGIPVVLLPGGSIGVPLSPYRGYVDLAKRVYEDVGNFQQWSDVYGFCEKAAEHIAQEGYGVVHLNDWLTAPVAGFLKGREMANTPILYVIHNAGYRGNINVGSISDLVKSIEAQDSGSADSKKAEVNRWLIGRLMHGPFSVGLNFGRVNFGNMMQVGLAYADKVLTVSPSYASELLELEGDGYLDIVSRSLLRDKGLEGILNGIDTEVLNPETSPHIVNYAINDMEGISWGKGQNKVRLLCNAGDGPIRDYPMVVSMMGRLASQKGIELILAAADRLKEVDDLKLLIIGELANKNMWDNVSKRLGVMPNIVFWSCFANERMQHLVFAGSDAVLVPSKYAPCELVAMEAMRFGAVPIVRATGGLKDIVTDVCKEEGNGIVFDDYTPEGLLNALKRAVAFLKDPSQRARVVRKCLEADHGWEKPAQRYVEIYEELVGKAACPN